MKQNGRARKIVAMLLTVCMLIGMLPVSSLAEDTQSTEEVLPNYLVDSFSDSQYVSGALYKWAASQSQSAERTVDAIAGSLHISNSHAQESDKNNAITYLTAADSAQDYAAAWTDYTVEAQLKFTGDKLTAQSKVGLVGRVQVTDGVITYYYAYIRNGNKNLFLAKGTIGADGVQTLTSITSKSLDAAVEAEKDYTLKLSFNGDIIKVYLDGEEQISATDPTYASGSVGIQFTRQGDAQVSYIKVIHNSDSTVFMDDFTDSRYLNGVTYQWSPDASDTWKVGDGAYEAVVKQLEPVAVTAKWNALDDLTNAAAGKPTSRSVADGCLLINNIGGNTDNNYANTYLSLMGAEEDYAANWTDYSVEVSVKLTDVPENTDKHKIAVLGRVTEQPDGSLTYYKLYCRQDNGYVYLRQCTLKDGTETEVNLGQHNIGVDVDAGYVTLKMTFASGKVQAFVNGSATACITADAVEGHAAGSVGVQFKRKGTVSVDYIKVTDANGITLFNEEFTDENCLTGTAGYLLDGVFTAGKPVYAAAEPSVNLVTLQEGETNHATAWTDYGIEADISLENAASAAGLVARANGGNCYAFRVSADTAALYKVSSIGETLLVSTPAAVETGTWQFVKMDVSGSTIKCYLNGALMLSYDASQDAGAYTSGTVGLIAAGSVKFDNFAAYPMEAAEARRFVTYKFDVSDISGLDSNWNINAASWSVSDGKLTASGADNATLKNKTMMEDYYAETKGSAADGGSIGVIGRCSYDGSSYYLLTADVSTGVQLKKTVGDVTETLAAVSYNELYLQGVKLRPGTEYTLRLQMYGNVIEGYVDGVRVIRYTDTNALTTGVSGVQGAAGASYQYLTNGKVDAVVKLTVLDASGNPIATAADPMEVPLGKVPDIKHAVLKVDYYDGNTESIMLDTAEVEAFDGSQLGAKTAKVAYLGAETVFHYTVIDRSGAIAQLEEELTALDATALTLENEAAVKALTERYNDLSYEEKANISTDSKAKLAAAQEAIEFLKYPELEGTNIVFIDEFDTAASRNMYDNSPSTMTWRRNSGNWYVENGTMVQYMTTTIGKPTQFNFSAILVDEDGNPENFEIRSVSLDVQFIDEKAWAGIEFCFGGGSNERYYFSITDKSNRIRLVKNQTDLAVVYADQDENPITFAPGQWYNLRVTLDGNGLIKCYVDDRLWIEWQDVPDVVNDQILTHGSVGMYGAENYVKYDNLVVRGTDLPYDYPDKVTVNPNPEAGAYSDDFDDETAGSSPSHWIELNTEDKWLVKEDGSNKVYASKDNTTGNSHTWLHVFETNVDYVANIRVTEKGYFPVVGLTTRVNADESWIKGGYDFTLKKWFIKVRLGADFEPVITYSANADTAVDFSGWVTLRMKVVDKTIELYANDRLVVTADAGTKVMPGRVGVFTEQCNVDVDDIALALLSGQGRVNEGVLEYYTNTGSSFHSILEMWDDEGNQILLLYEDGTQSISTDGGQTFTRSTMYSSAGFVGNGSLELHDGSYINIKRRGGSDEATLNDRVVYLSTDGGKSWPEITIVPTDPAYTYAQPAEHINEVQLNDGTWRVFYSLCNSELGCSIIYYTDDGGYTWKESENTPLDFTNVGSWNESYVIKISKDTTDLNGREIKAGTLIQYSSHNEADCVRYTLSYDDGVTWVGDYALPQIPCGENSCCIKEDPYEPGTYYMVAPYNITVGLGFHHPRFRVVLLRSYDGLNWEFLADVDRWGDISDGNRGNIMQQVNAYLCITEDYVFPIFSRSDQYLDSGSHNLQIGRMYRFEKDKLEAYDPWPQEYIIPDKAITAIDVVDAKTTYTQGEAYSTEGKVKLYYYDGTTGLFDLADAFITEPNLDALGEAKVVVDFKHFRAIYNVNVVAASQSGNDNSDGGNTGSSETGGTTTGGDSAGSSNTGNGSNAGGNSSAGETDNPNTGDTAQLGLMLAAALASAMALAAVTIIRKKETV